MVGGVYRGGAYPSSVLPNGTLLFGEYYVGFMRGILVNDTGGIINDNVGAPGFHIVHKGAITSMVQGPDGHMYLTSQYGPATVYRLVYQAPVQ